MPQAQDQPAQEGLGCRCDFKLSTAPCRAIPLSSPLSNIFFREIKERVQCSVSVLTGDREKETAAESWMPGELRAAGRGNGRIKHLEVCTRVGGGHWNLHSM